VEEQNPIVSGKQNPAQFRAINYINCSYDCFLLDVMLCYFFGSMFVMAGVLMKKLCEDPWGSRIFLTVGFISLGNSDM